MTVTVDHLIALAEDERNLGEESHFAGGIDSTLEFLREGRAHLERRAVEVSPDGRRGDWMQTFTGQAFWPLDARPAEVDPVDVAHALAHLCRYGGHASRFYSVAEHCVLMSHVVPPDDALAALLHDATEAYMVDLPRPIKRQFPEYRAAEDRLWLVIAERFGVDAVLPASVHDADNRILLDERAALLGPQPRPWAQDLEQLSALGIGITGWPPSMAKVAYLARLRELTGGVS